jgi:BlaI family penicillinase repressor
MKKGAETLSKPPRLSEAEWTIMKRFWEKGALAARDLYAALPPSHTWSYKTVKTMLARLVKKGALHYRQIGNSYLYDARFGRDEMVKSAVKHFSRRVLDGALRPFLVSFFEDKRPSQEEISTLRDMIKHLEEKKSGNKQRERGIGG